MWTDRKPFNLLCIAYILVSLKYSLRMQLLFLNLDLKFSRFFFVSPPGLKVEDEILLLNGKPASALQMEDMRAAFVNQALTLSVSTLPQLDSRLLCLLPPRRSDGEQELATDIFSQSQGKPFTSVYIIHEIHFC